MRAATIVCLLVAGFACMVSAASTKRTVRRGWFSKAWDSVKNTAEDAWDWTKENCAVGTSGINCNLSGLKRNTGPAAALEAACPGFDFGPSPAISDVMLAAFETVDEDGNGVLDDVESNNFSQLMAVLQFCAENVVQ